MMARCLLLATYQPTHYFCLAFREQFLQQRLSHCHPSSSSSLGTAPVFKETQTGSEAASVEFLNFVKTPTYE